MRARAALAIGMAAAALVAAASGPAPAARWSPAERRVAARFESLRAQPAALRQFVQDMPKGGDLHSHLSGAIYSESLIGWAAAAGLCVNRATLALSRPPCDASADTVPADAALSNPALYARMIDAWSMRNSPETGLAGHDHFFSSFDKFLPATAGQFGAMLAEVTSRAARNHVSYLELMVTPDDGAAGDIAEKAGWNEDLAATRARLQSAGIDQAVGKVREAIQSGLDARSQLQHCGAPADADPGCAVTVRFLYQALRAIPIPALFAQLVTGFTLANTPGSPVVGVNLVQPEDGPSAMQNFSATMRMIAFLRPLYPAAHLSLHAGELSAALVPPAGLQFHIRESIEVAGAERVGHGVDVLQERDHEQLLEEMARKRVLVEICLTSNDVILGIRGKAHPLAAYLAHGVPVALATDDEGVSRSEMSEEFRKAAVDQQLGYLTLKSMARASLEHAFVPGASLWSDEASWTRAPACATDAAAARIPSRACDDLLTSSPRAALQWQLERAFSDFESK